MTGGARYPCFFLELTNVSTFSKLADLTLPSDAEGKRKMEFVVSFGLVCLFVLGSVSIFLVLP